VNVRIHPYWTFAEVRRAALALSRAVERRAPALASSKWWKEERHGVFLDYNQNAKDRTTCSAYSVRPLSDAWVSVPLRWHEVPDCEPTDFTVLTMPKRFAEFGDLHADIDAAQVRSINCLRSQQGMKLQASAMRRGRHTFARWKTNRGGLPNPWRINLRSTDVSFRAE
jgi:DNA primase